MSDQLSFNLNSVYLCILAYMKMFACGQLSTKLGFQACNFDMFVALHMFGHKYSAAHCMG